MCEAINTNDAKQLRKAISVAPRGRRPLVKNPSGEAASSGGDKSPGKMDMELIYPLVMTNITMESHHL